MSKNKLQEFAQKHCLSLPIYSFTKEGPDHAPRFRATVTFNGHVYSSPGYNRNVKQAENAAAEAALSQLSYQSEHRLQKMEHVTVHIKPSEVPSDLQRESNKEQKSERKNEILQKAESVAPISKVGTENAQENSELRADSSHLTQSPRVAFYSPRIQAVKVRELCKSENSGKTPEKQNIMTKGLIREVSCNEINREQAHRMAAGATQEKQKTQDIIQNSEGTISTSKFHSVQMTSVEVPSNLQKESRKEQKSDGKEETVHEAEDLSSTSESGIANVPINSELEFQGSPVSESLGKVTGKRSMGNISLTTEISCNETHREQAEQMTVGVIEDRQWNRETNQQSKEIFSTPPFISDTHKTLLQEFAIKGGFDLPCYSSIREGPAHALRFKATVKFNGETYEGPGFSNTLRQAEHAAATVALKSLSGKGSSLEELSMHKNLLQEKAQKEGKDLPVYTTTKSGPSHMPVFKCTLKFDGMTFEGKYANTKKQAEKNAAAVAWHSIENCKRLSFSNEQFHDDKLKGLIYEHNDCEQVHMKKEATKELGVQFSHVLSRNISGVSHSPPSEASNMGLKKELLHNTTSVVGNNVKNEFNTSPSTKHPSGRRIRVLPDCSSSTNPYMAVNITGDNGTMQNQNNA